ncbi:nicotinic acetylcholine receptor non alpha [Trichuris trichiura]|uniref:Nicotinic acetylcholine receptor non alpha n=1 Tax=Trichuris trichiura TaxID=36087 RepID=A0A077Z9A7_TRITR|nr:nicotinic acetylcholine receptor non alpha [Trichuris trichiura]
MHSFLFLTTAAALTIVGSAQYDEDKIYSHIFQDYNSVVLPDPIDNKSSRVVVAFGLSMVLLVNVSWIDPGLRWNPAEFNMVTEIRAPVHKLWQPDIVLLNNSADGNYDVSFYSNAKVESDGTVLWVPPAIYKSACRMDVQHFPFDEQTCLLVFGSSAYTNGEVQFAWYKQRNFIQLEDFSFSSIWDVVDVPGSLSEFDSKITFYVKIRRKPLFYTVILILPTVMMAYLSVFVFYLPAGASEKITLSVNLLLALVVFMLLVSKILPCNSNTMPFLAKYLLITFVLDVAAIITTIAVLNVYFRPPSASRLPSWARNLFLKQFPRLLLMRTPRALLRQRRRLHRGRQLVSAAPMNNGHMQRENRAEHSASQEMTTTPVVIRSTNLHISKSDERRFSEETLPACNHLLNEALTSADQIFNHYERMYAEEMRREEWTFVSLILDRFLLFIFFGITLGGTFNVFAYVPNLFDRVDQLNCSEDEDRLMVDLFRGYNSLVLPLSNANSTPLLLHFGLQLVLLINLDEKNQIMHTNVWLTLKWYDFQMRWNPVNYGEIRQIRVATDKVWRPDIVLFNNADGNYEVSFHSNVVIDNEGNMLWVPPAIYKSSCIIDVEYFPFDEQVCTLLFGSWTYNEQEIILSFNDGVEGVDLQDYSYSSIWDIIEAPAVLTRQKSRMEFRIRVRRKSLFYTVVLIIPTVLMAFLSMMVFYLPACAGEKITLTLNVLLSLVVFLLLVSKILPPTSSTIPLMAKYLLLTFLLNIITILVTVLIINVFFRGPTTHRMPQWVRHTFLDFLPKMLMMKRPKRVSKEPHYGVMDTFHRHKPVRTTTGQSSKFSDSTEPPAVPMRSVIDHRNSDGFTYHSLANQYPLSREACKAIEAIEYIAEHLRTDEEYQSIREDWKYVAMVIDRLLLYIFFGVTLGGTVGILLSAPNVFEFVDQQEVVNRLLLFYRGES